MSLRFQFSILLVSLCFQHTIGFHSRALSTKRTPWLSLRASSSSFEKFRKYARSQFPFFNGNQPPNYDSQFDSNNWLFFDNAGGSQVPQVVVDAANSGMAVRWRDEVGRRYISEARATVAAMLGTEPLNVIFSCSASTLLRSLAVSYGQKLQSGDEILICDWAHESQISPWLLAAKLSNATVKWCHINPETCEMPDASTVANLCTSKTKLVALTHVSNILGNVYDVKATTKAVKDACNADVVIDGVAYVPHMNPNVTDIGCDWYAFSCYKAFGPHMAAMAGSTSALKNLKPFSQNHKFVNPDSIGYSRWELGTSNQEGAAGMAALSKYFRYLAAFSQGDEKSKSMDLSAAVGAAYKLISESEEAPGALLLDYLLSNPRVKVLGSPSMKDRIPTISVLHSSMKAQQVCEATKLEKIICRFGIFQSPRLLTAVGVPDPYGDGVLRFSFAHYNTLEDVEKLISVLEGIGF